MLESSGANSLLNSSDIIRKLQLQPDMQVADCGCGNTGHFVFPIAQVLDQGKIYAVDIQKAVIDNLHSLSLDKGLPNVETVWSDLEIYGATKIAQNSLDRVLLINVLYQTQDHRAVIREALRLLKIGGLLMIIDWKNQESPLGPPLAKRVSREELEDTFMQLNLDNIGEFEAGAYHHGYILKKQF